MSLDEIMWSMKDSSAGQMPEPGVTVIIVIPLRLGVSVDNRWITVVRSVRSNSQDPTREWFEFLINSSCKEEAILSL